MLTPATGSEKNLGMEKSKSATFDSGRIVRSSLTECLESLARVVFCDHLALLRSL